jgi:hypothetical protein
MSLSRDLRPFAGASDYGSRSRFRPIRRPPRLRLFPGVALPPRCHPFNRAELGPVSARDEQGGEQPVRVG